MISKHPKVDYVVGIDPGIHGAIVMTDGRKLFKYWKLPIKIDGKEKYVHFEEVNQIFQLIVRYQRPHVYLERAIPFALGSKSAFTYGRGFEALLIALRVNQIPFTLVEPGRWTKEMHEGISADFKPKKKSSIAVERLYPHLVALLPKEAKNGKKLADGPVDALLIAGYGLRKGNAKPPVKSNIKDFF